MPIWRLSSLRYKDPLPETHVLLPGLHFLSSRVPHPIPSPSGSSQTKTASCAPAPRSSDPQLVGQCHSKTRRSRRSTTGSTPRSSNMTTSQMSVLSLFLSLQRWTDRLSYTLIEPQALVDDPNFDPAAIGLEDESPYPEVRSAVANTDDPTIPASTFRAWVFGLFWAIVIPGANQFFFFRYPSVTISQVCLPLSFLSFLCPPLLNQVPCAKSSSSPSFCLSPSANCGLVTCQMFPSLVYRSIRDHSLSKSTSSSLSWVASGLYQHTQ